MNDYWAKAIVDARSGHLLLRSGDTDSAVSRAYFATYDAARAALETIDPKLAVSKKHSTTISRFPNTLLLASRRFSD